MYGSTFSLLNIAILSFAHPDVVAGCPVDHMEEPALNKEAKDFELENLADFMDFSITDVAEQLTRMDTVSARVSLLTSLWSCKWSSCNVGVLVVVGLVHEGGPFPMSGLCVVSTRQEGEPLTHYLGHHLPVQCSHQLGHHFSASSLVFCFILPNHTKSQSHRKMGAGCTGKPFS